jgi:hypothetical protein
VKVRRRWSDDGLARLGGQLEYGWDRCWRCDLWLRCRGAWPEEVGVTTRPGKYRTIA